MKGEKMDKEFMIPASVVKELLENVTFEVVVLTEPLLPPDITVKKISTLSDEAKERLGRIINEELGKE